MSNKHPESSDVPSGAVRQEVLMVQPSPNELRWLALMAQVCEATVLRFFKGRPVRPGSRERIERALARRSMEGGVP